MAIKVGTSGHLIHPNTKFSGMRDGIDFASGKSIRAYCWGDSLVNKATGPGGCDFKPLAGTVEAVVPAKKPVGRPRREDRPDRV